MKNILIFTLDDCGYCYELKKKLISDSIKFHNINIIKNRKLWEQVSTQINDDVVPTVFIQENDNGDGLVYVPGRDFNDLDEIVKIIKRNI